MITVGVRFGAVKVGIGCQIVDVEVTELLVLVANRVVTRAVHASDTCRSISIHYNTPQQEAQLLL